MQKSHVLINCDRGTEELLSSEIMKIKNVKNIDKTAGLYDLVVELESNDEEQLRKVIGSRIKNMNHIRSTLMLVHA